MRLPRGLKLIGVNLLVLGVGLAAIELAFGGWIFHDRLNRLHLAKNRRRVYDVRGLYPSATGRAVSTRDRYGLRGTYGDPSRIDILTAGGSTTDQRFITDGETWQDVMQKDFQAQGMDVRVANAGVDGQSTYGHIKAFEWWFPHVPGLRPDLVVFYVGLNDFYRDADHEKDDLGEDRRRSLRGRLEDDSASYHLFRTLRGMYKAEVVHRLGHEGIDFQRLKWTDRPLIEDHAALMEPRLASYERRLTILCAKAKEIGAVPVLVTQPSRRYRLGAGGVEGAAKPFGYAERRINGVDFYFMLRRLNERTLSVGRREGGIAIDLAAEVSMEDADFYDFHHLSPAGAAKVGHHLFRSLRETMPATRK